MSRASLLALVLLAVVSAPGAGCSQEPVSPAPSPGAHFTSEAEWIDLAGLRARLERERGRVVVVNYWATWCEPCREEFPELSEFHRHWGARGVTLWAISLDTAKVRDTEVKKFLAEQRVPFPVFIKTAAEDPDDFINTVDEKWSGALPATFVYDRQGQRRHSLFGQQTRRSLEAVVEPLLAGE